MTEKPEKIALALEPETGVFALITLLIALEEHVFHDSWQEAKQFVLDLEMIAPQVIWVESKQLEKLKARLAELAISSRVVSREEADRIGIENKPVRGGIDLHIRTRDSEINSGMIENLKAKNLISHYHTGSNADDIFHWKDDRWYQDFHLFIFKEEDIAEIELLIRNCGYIIVRPEESGPS